jgi:predicted alpha-1,2-mannosidase
MKRIFFLLLLLMLRALQTTLSAQTPADFVNPFIGTGGHGHTFPGAVLPFGMVQLSPDTRLSGWDGCSGYHYTDSVIYGFSHTHLSGTGVPDYGDLLLMPTVGKPQLSAFADGSYKKGYASHFSHKNEAASPGYYSVHLDDENIDAELTVTQRVGFHKYTFPETKQANIILDLTHRDKVLDAYVRVIDRRHIEGYRRSTGWANNQVVYFYAEFSKQIETCGVTDGKKTRTGFDTTFSAKGTDVKAWFQFHTGQGESISVKMAISQVSMEGAKANLRECMSWDFEAVKRNAAATWNYELSKIDVRGKSEEQKRIFYSSLYHCMIHPSLASDVDGKYLGRDLQVHQLKPGKSYYTVFSLWDTYRALHPLLTIIDQKRTSDFINTFLLQYEQGGRLPVWELSSNETDCMIGYHCISVMADAALKGIKFDYQKALEAMITSAHWDDPGLNALRKQGYIGSEDDHESVSKTLEYAYDDWCIAQMAKLAGDSAAYNEFIGRAQNWKNIFDWNRGFMRPKKNGGWISPFDPFEVNHHFTEGNAWQYNFAVPQDIDGMISMMGGKEAFETKLDSLFSVSSKTSGLELPDVSGLIGQYAHGNEPSHHMAYLYDYCGAPWKTQERVRQILNEMYHDAPDGLSGNEDCGQMSAWYVMSAMGFYEVTPGYPYYAIGSPLFDTVKIHLENNKTFTVIAQNNDAQNKYLSAISFNGNRTDSMLFSNTFMRRGGVLELMMSSEENTVPFNVDFAPSKEINEHRMVIDPLLVAGSATFTDSLTVNAITFPDKEHPLELKWNIIPSPHFNRESKSVTLYETSRMTLHSTDGKGNSSREVTARFVRTNKNWKITYLIPCNPQYTGGGDMTLMDEQSGGTNFKDGSWQGWWGKDMQVIIDLGKEISISKVSAEFLQDQRSWILMPKEVDVELSGDGKTFSRATKAVSSVMDKDETAHTARIGNSFKPVTARYIRITAHNYGQLPAWHISAGGDAWIFCDEIFIE